MQVDASFLAVDSFETVPPTRRTGDRPADTTFTNLIYRGNKAEVSRLKETQITVERDVWGRGNIRFSRLTRSRFA